MRLVGTSLDVTAKRALEEQLRAAKEAAEAANRAKSDFLAHMSHEIRTPLNAVLGLTQVLEQAPLTPDQRDMVQQIRTAGRSLLGLLNDILDLSKIEAGQLHLDQHPFALAPLLERVEALQGGAARAKGLQFRIQASAIGEEDLVGDPLRLEQILLNLISNAIKYNVPGGRVTLAAEESDDQHLEIRVRDSGIRWGLDGEHRRAHGLPASFTATTWADGVERVLLGVTTASRTLVPGLGNVVPVDIEGSDVRLIVRLAAAVSQLRQCMDEVRALDVGPPVRSTERPGTPLLSLSTWIGWVLESLDALMPAVQLAYRAARAWILSLIHI